MFGTNALTTPQDIEVHTVGFEQVLGTTFELTILAEETSIDPATERALATIDTLEPIFTRFYEDSEVRRWLRYDVDAPSKPLREVLERAEYWTAITGGAFHPGVEALRRVWGEAEAINQRPNPIELERISRQLRDYRHNEQVDVWSSLVTEGTERLANLDAIAKGFIADQIVASVRQLPHVSGVVANLGGDIRVSSRHAVSIALPNPMDPFESASGVDRIDLLEGAVATSGIRVRGFRVQDRWYPHLLDPRTGEPVEQVVGATIIAPTCMDADALATAFCVLSPDDSVTLANQQPGVACRIHQRDGSTLSSNSYMSSVHTSTPTSPKIGYQHAFTL